MELFFSSSGTESERASGSNVNVAAVDASPQYSDYGKADLGALVLGNMHLSYQSILASLLLPDSSSLSCSFAG